MRRLFPIPLIIVAACGHGGSAALSTPKVDTLPGGMVEVKNDGPSAWADSSGWRLVEVRHFKGDSSGPGELTQPGGLAIDGAGSIYVIQTGPARISKFDSAGRFVRQIGHEGDGPGEFRFGMLAIVHDTLVVQDPNTSRITIFDTAGRFIRTFHSECCYFGGGYLADSTGLVYVPTHPRHPETDDVAFLRFRIGGALVDTVELHSPGQGKFWGVKGMRFNIQYTPGFIGRPDGFGNGLSAWTGNYRVAVLSNWKDTSLVFSLKAPPVPVPERLRDSAVAWVTRGNPQMVAVAKLSDVPEYAPPLGYVDRDPAGDFWVMVGVSGTPSFHYDVFDRSGRYLGAVPRPPKLSYSWIFGRDRMDAVVERDDGGFAIATYRIDRRGH